MIRIYAAEAPLQLTDLCESVLVEIIRAATSHVVELELTAGRDSGTATISENGINMRKARDERSLMKGEFTIQSNYIRSYIVNGFLFFGRTVIDDIWVTALYTELYRVPGIVEMPVGFNVYIYTGERNDGEDINKLVVGGKNITKVSGYWSAKWRD